MPTLANKITSTATIAVAPIKPYAFKGANKLVRGTALAGVASCAYAEGMSRAELIAQLALALGKKPSVDDVAAARCEYIVGRTAQRLAASDLPKATMTVAERIDYARRLIVRHASPAQDGVSSRPLRRGQEGRRTVSQHKVIRAAEESWSHIKAEIGIGAAQTQGAKNAKQTRKARTPSSGTVSTAGQGITHSELVAKDGGPIGAAEAVAYIDQMARTLEQFCKKHAAVVPSNYGQSVTRFCGAIIQAAKDVKLAK